MTQDGWWAKVRVTQVKGGKSRRVDGAISSTALALVEHRASRQRALPRKAADGLGAEGVCYPPRGAAAPITGGGWAHPRRSHQHG
jgi:hypothetical protein